MSDIHVDYLGQIVLYRSTLEVLGVAPGDSFTLTKEGDNLVLTPLPKAKDKPEYREYMAINYETNEGIYKDSRRETIPPGVIAFAHAEELNE